MHTCYLHWYNYVDPRFQCFLHTINKQKKIPLLRDTRSDFCLWTQGNLYNTKRNWGTQEISMDLCRCKLFWKIKIFQWQKKESKSLELLYIQFSDKLSMQSPFCPSYYGLEECWDIQNALKLVHTFWNIVIVFHQIKSMMQHLQLFV